MTEERDARVAAAYRDLGAQEPPRTLDDAILAASRRPPRSWTQRWALPLSIAAVVVLSVTVTLHVQQEQPGLNGVEAPQAAKEARAPERSNDAAQPLKLKPEDQLKLPPRSQAKLEARRAEPKAFADAGADRAPASAAPRAPVAAAPPAGLGELASRGDAGRGASERYADSALRREEERVARDAEAAARAPQVGAALAKRSAPAPAAASAQAAKPSTEPAAKTAEQPGKLAAETPELELERIAKLRAEGRNDEADKAFLEFRRRYPSFRITEDMLRRVERR